MTPPETASDLVLVTDRDRVRTLTLNRPRALNAFNRALCVRLTECLRDAIRDDAVHVVVLTGQGRAFSAGTDLYELAENGDFRDPQGSPHGFEGLIDVVAEMSKPLILAINGLAVGVGATLLGVADLAILSTDARLRCPFTELGLVPEAGASVTFPLLLGRQAAAWMLLSSEWVEADEAVRVGLAWRVVPADRLEIETAAAARRLARHSLGSLSASKRLLTAAYADLIRAARQRENAAFDELLVSSNHRSALDVFLSRRPGGATTSHWLLSETQE